MEGVTMDNKTRKIKKSCKFNLVILGYWIITA